jgi:hypothetical protein
MKSILLLLLLFSVTLFYASATENQNQSFKIISVSNDHLDIEFNLPTYRIDTVLEDGITFQRIKADNCDYLVKTGFPELPIYSTMIALPNQGAAQVTILSTEQQEINSFKPYPSQSRIANDETPKSFTMDHDFYSGSSTYPPQLIQYGKAQILRDFRVMNVSIQPFTYTAGNQTLSIQKKIILRVDFTRGSGENEMDQPITYSRSFEPIYKALILNYNESRDVALPYNPERILVIRHSSTDQTFLNKFNEFVMWKKQKGYEVAVATTTETGTNTSTIKNYIQTQYNNLNTRPDYVILVGDVSGTFGIPTWNYSWNYYNGETDYPYTQIAGNDLLGDVFIGRMSIESTSDFLNLATKVFTYEKNTPTQPATWLNRMLLVGDDQSSGISTMYTNKFIKELSYAHNPNYTYNEVYGGSFTSAINAGINQGVGFWNYRGYIGMSGWSPGSGIVNSGKLLHAVIITCATGSFSGGTSTTESLIRMGTASNPTGSITAIGMATSGTHTMLNNCLAGGIFEGLFTYNMHTMGQALLYSKLYLHSVYSMSEPTLETAFEHICNLMGDPTVEAYKGIPSRILIECPTSIPKGTNMIEISVNDMIAHHIENSNVTLSQGSTIMYNGISDANGKVYAVIPEDMTGQLTLTVSKPDFYPSIATIDISTEGSLICDSLFIDDDGNGSSTGNNNHQVNGGETIEFSVNLKNTSSSIISDIGGDLISTDTDVQISNISSSFNDFAPGVTGYNNQAYVFTVSANCPDRKIIHFTLQLSNGINLPILIEVRNADMDVSSLYVNDNGNHVLDPGESSILNITLINNGLIPLTGLTGILHSNSNLVNVTDTLAVFGDVAPGNSISCNTDAFNIHGQMQLVKGMQVPFTLRLSNTSGYSEIETFILNIGLVTVNDPLGPDDYGYLIYDMSDTGYPDVPDYNWVGIAPAESGSGTILNFNDTGSDYDEGDSNGSISILPVSLPFSFSFYGITYQTMSVCSNGFITFINSLNGDFRNWHLPGALGPNAMIAAFWDDLILLSGSGVYTYYDVSQHRFIIEWYLAKNGYNRTSEETFEIILYDPSYYPTSSGDGQIKIQYKVFNNVDAGGSGAPAQGNYCTIGIKDQTGLRGLEYTFNNLYPTAAAPLTNHKALLITGTPILLEAPHLLLGEMVITDFNGNQIAEPGEYINLGIRLSNMGLSAALNVNATISSTDPYVTILSASSTYDPIPGQSTGINKNFFHIQISPNCPNDHVIPFVVDITAQGYTWQRFATLRVTKPAITFENTYINDMYGNNNGQADPSENFKLILNIRNTGSVDVENVTINTSCINSSLQISNPTTTISKILAGRMMQVNLAISLTENAQVGTYIPIQYAINASNVLPVNGQFSLGVSTTGIFDTFEANNGNFVSLGGWVWGSSSQTNGHSGRNMWGTSLSAEYPVNCDYVLKTPQFMIGSNAQLKFWHKYDSEATYDGGNVSISTDGGSSFTLITPLSGYPSQSVYSLPEPNFSGSMLEWTQVVFDLSQYSNQQIMIQWHFCSDSMINGQGWFVDDLEISGFITATGIIKGNLLFTGDIPDLQQAVVHAGSFDVKPDLTGYYQFYLPTGNYSVSEEMPSYQTFTTQSVIVNPVNPLHTVDFEMNYLPRVTHLYYQVSNQHLSMSWSPPIESQNQLIHYNVFRRIDADHFQLVTETAIPNYTENLQTLGQYSYFITTDYQQGISAASDTIAFNSGETGSTDNPIIPPKTVLYGNYPNPFNPDTHISFALAKPGIVRLDIYNVKGQLVTVLKDEYLNVGQHEAIWNGTDRYRQSVASGVYFYRLSTSDYTSTRKALLLK